MGESRDELPPSHQSSPALIGAAYRARGRMETGFSPANCNGKTNACSPRGQPSPAHAPAHPRGSRDLPSVKLGAVSRKSPAMGTSEPRLIHHVTEFSDLEVLKERRRWTAYRDTGFQLLKNGKPASFATRQEAQRIAELHELDGCGNSDRIDDGYTWSLDPFGEPDFDEHGPSVN